MKDGDREPEPLPYCGQCGQSMMRPKTTDLSMGFDRYTGKKATPRPHVTTQCPTMHHDTWVKGDDDYWTLLT